MVHVVRQVKIVGGKPCFGPPKSGKTRDVPLPGSIAADIRAHMAAYPRCRSPCRGRTADYRPADRDKP